jgi:hypothetical protein
MPTTVRHTAANSSVAPNGWRADSLETAIGAGAGGAGCGSGCRSRETLVSGTRAAGGVGAATSAPVTREGFTVDFFRAVGRAVGSVAGIDEVGDAGWPKLDAHPHAKREERKLQGPREVKDNGGGAQA